MKDRYYSIGEISGSIENVVSRTIQFVQTSRNSAQNASPYKPQPSSKNRLVVGKSFRSQKWKDLVGFLIILHFYPMEEPHWWYVCLDLEAHIRENPDSFWLSVLVENKELFLLWLQNQQTISSHSFYSSICNVNNLDRLLGLIITNFEKKLRKPKRSERKRGYKDKGTRPSPSTVARREEVQREMFFTEKQIISEEKELFRQEAITSFRDYLMGCRALSDELLILFRILPRKNSNAKVKNSN